MAGRFDEISQILNKVDSKQRDYLKQIVAYFNGCLNDIKNIKYTTKIYGEIFNDMVKCVDIIEKVNPKLCEYSPQRILSVLNGEIEGGLMNHIQNQIKDGQEGNWDD